MKRKRSGSDSRAPQGLCVVCQLPGVRRPYVTYWQSNVISLRHYKGLIITLQRRAAKLLNKELPQLQAYRYFFKCESSDFPPGVVYQECCNDEAFVPQWRGIVWGKMELNESSPS
ncbi:unnamed protein product [Dicrocoelium dendriticum]|nr:unnamed protein product [Dicrocoelium dendriticum]